MRILLTGVAGFIGFHVCHRLLTNGHTILGLDNINNYYSTVLKYNRLLELGIANEKINWNHIEISDKYQNLRFIQLSVEDCDSIQRLFSKEKFDIVCHLAAQAGVRYSLENPQAYIDSNITGFLNILEGCRYNPVQHLVYASSSSIYGLNNKSPFKEQDNVDHPASIYAATKKSNELMAHTYSHLYNIPTTGLRFFTVYGPWGRPDMAPFLFTDAILHNRPIKVFNNGNMLRDFTYIDDIVEGIVRVIDHRAISNLDWNPDKPDAATSSAPYKIYNIGNSSPVSLIDFIKAIEKSTGKKAEKIYYPMQPGDVVKTYADTTSLEKDINFKPSISIEDGVKKTVDWFKEYYNY